MVINLDKYTTTQQKIIETIYQKETFFRRIRNEKVILTFKKSFIKKETVFNHYIIDEVINKYGKEIDFTSTEVLHYIERIITKLKLFPELIIRGKDIPTNLNIMEFFIKSLIQYVKELKEYLLFQKERNLYVNKKLKHKEKLNLMTNVLITRYHIQRIITDEIQDIYENSNRKEYKYDNYFNNHRIQNLHPNRVSKNRYR